MHVLQTLLYVEHVGPRFIIFIFEHYKVIADLFGNNMELLARGRIKPTMHQFIPAGV